MFVREGNGRTACLGNRNVFLRLTRQDVAESASKKTITVIDGNIWDLKAPKKEVQ